MSFIKEKNCSCDKLSRVCEYGLSKFLSSIRIEIEIDWNIGTKLINNHFPESRSYIWGKFSIAYEHLRKIFGIHHSSTPRLCSREARGSRRSPVLLRRGPRYTTSWRTRYPLFLLSRSMKAAVCCPENSLPIARMCCTLKSPSFCTAFTIFSSLWGSPLLIWLRNSHSVSMHRRQSARFSVWMWSSHIPRFSGPRLPPFLALLFHFPSGNLSSKYLAQYWER